MIDRAALRVASAREVAPDGHAGRQLGIRHSRAGGLISSRAAQARRRRWAAALAVVFVALAAAGCGKKGAPLPPFAKAPAAPASPSARRLGNIVEIRFTVPVVDLDGQRPANLDRVEVWALTGQVADPALFLEYATLVGTVPVRPPPPPPDVKEGEPPPPPPPPSTEPGLDQGQPGLVVDELTPEDLTPVVVPEIEEQTARDLEARQERLARLGPLTLTPPDVGTPLPSPLMRYYVVMGRNGGRKGAMSPRLAVPLRDAPPAPSAPTAVAAETHVELTWTAPPNLRQPVHKGTAVAPPPAVPGRPGARAPAAAGATAVAAAPAGLALPSAADAEDAFDDDQLQLRPQPPPAAEPGAILTAPPQPAAPAAPPAPAPPEAPAAPEAAVAPAGASPAQGLTAAPAAPPVLNSRTLTGLPAFVNGYVVYEVPRPATPPPELQPGQEPALPRRATPAPIAVTTWRDDKVAFGSERCYQVRTVETSGTPIESEPSEVLCVSPTDTFPPRAPASLGAVGSQGAISLIWNANTEPDLGGYLVLRGRAGGGALQPLTPKPITETTYRDDTVQPGTRYVYAIVAVDKATPANVSAESNRVEETAR